MLEFDPDTPVKRGLLQALSAPHERIMWALNHNSIKGFVSWDYNYEERSILKAFYHALGLIRTDCSNEWVVAGSGVFALLRSLDEFVPLDTPQIACGLTYAGKIHRLQVFLRPAAPPLEFSIGNHGVYVRGICINFPRGLGYETPPAMDKSPDDPLAYFDDVFDDSDDTLLHLAF